MTDEKFDKRELQREVRQIKEAMGLYERYPSFARWWLVEGVGVGIFGLLIQFSLLLDSVLLVVVGVGVIGIAIWVERRWAFAEDAEGPARPPDWNAWYTPVLVGIGGVGVGLLPALVPQSGVNAIVYGFVLGGGMLGVGYMYMGHLLGAHGVRKADRHAFSASGLWILALVAVVPNVLTLRRWGMAVFGVGIAIQHVGAYVYLSRT